MRPSELLNHLMTDGVKSNGVVYTIPDAYGFKVIDSYSDLVDKQYVSTKVVDVPAESFMLDIAYACKSQGKVLYVDTAESGQYQTPIMKAANRERRTNWTRSLQEQPDLVVFRDIPIVSNYEFQFIPPRTVDYLITLNDDRLLDHQQYKNGVLNEASKYDIVVATQRSVKYLTPLIEQRSGIVRAYVQPV